MYGKWHHGQLYWVAPLQIVRFLSCIYVLVYSVMTNECISPSADHCQRQTLTTNPNACTKPNAKPYFPHFCTLCRKEMYTKWHFSTVTDCFEGWWWLIGRYINYSPQFHLLLVFTARRYASAVLGVVILSVRQSNACFVTNPKNVPPIFLYHMKGQSF